MASIVGYTKAKIDQILAQSFVSLVSPALAGNPTAPTPAAGDNDTSIATTAFVATSFALKDSPIFIGTPEAPTKAPGDNTTALATTAFVATSFAPLASPTLTGDPKAPTPAAGDNDTSIATTAFVVTSFATKESPTFTGDPKVPTATAGNSDTSIASTAFVQGEKLKVVNPQTGTAYTLVLSDKDKVIESSNASVQTITVPPNTSVAFPIGTIIQITWAGATKPSVAAGAGVTINSPGGLLGCRVAWSTITLRKRGTDLWILSDDVG